MLCDCAIHRLGEHTQRLSTVFCNAYAKKMSISIELRGQKMPYPQNIQEKKLAIEC